MMRVVILGGSVAGLLSGIQLARRGHRVTVLEQEPLSAIARAVDAPTTIRAGAPHAVQGHGVLARATVEIRRALPDVYATLLQAGVGELKLVENMPAAITDRSPRPGDDQLVMVTTRRHTLDRVLAEVAQSTPCLELRCGVGAHGLVFSTGAHGTKRVTGVRVCDAEILQADCVVDACGRRTPVPRWLAAEGVELPLEAWDCGLIYFTRHYQIRPGVARPPLNRIFVAGAFLPSLLIGFWPGDNDTAMLSQTLLAEDTLLRSVRHAAKFDAVARAVPSIAGWLDCADPITDIFGMGAFKNTLRRVVRDGRPGVLGLHLVGDAACTTNPTLGRGLSFAAAYARRLAEVLDSAPEDPFAQAHLLDDFVTQEIEPWFRQNAQFDRARVQLMRADLAGEAQPAPPPANSTLRPDELLVAGMADPELFRVYMRYSQLLADPGLLSERALVERVRRLVPQGMYSPTSEGPSRSELTRILAQA